MYPIPAPTECAPTGMRQAGGPPRAASNEEGHWERSGSRCPVEGAGGGRGFPNPGRLSRSSFLPPRPTAPRRRPSSWGRICTRYVPGRVAGQARASCQQRAPRGRGRHLGGRVESFPKLLAMGSPGGGKRKVVPALGKNRVVVGGGEGQQPATPRKPRAPLAGGAAVGASQAGGPQCPQTAAGLSTGPERGRHGQAGGKWPGGGGVAGRRGLDRTPLSKGRGRSGLGSPC